MKKRKFILPLTAFALLVSFGLAACNGGGNGGAQYRALGFSSKNGEFTGGGRDSLSKLAYSFTYAVDTNNDGVYNSSDGYPDYNWYILTSNYTYSSANLYSHYARYNNSNVKILGQTAGGGGCSILPMVMIDGTLFQISSKNQSAIITARGTSYNYELLENGPTVDYEIAYDKYYDRDYLINFINGLR